MKIGDLVKNRYGEHGIIIRRIGIADRWWIEWLVGPPYAINVNKGTEHHHRVDDLEAA